MAFLKNAWYCAGWDQELGAENLIGRKLVGEPVLLYRKMDGTPVAINNRCPHRFAPLHLGTRNGDAVACPYHGLEFGPSGECTRNPHGDCKIPKAAQVPAYPLVERWKALWIWMGDPKKADPALIPDFSMTMPGEGVSVIYGHHEVKANYQLVADNLLDRSHVKIMHPLLIPTHEPADAETHQSVEQVGDTVWDFHSQVNHLRYPMLGALWPDAPERIENHFDVRWDAPCNMLLRSGTYQVGTNKKVGVNLPMANLVTPADDHHTHYFWNQSRDRNINSPEMDAKIHHGVTSTFKNEDGAMVTACAELMNGETDLMKLKPVLLPSDAAALRVRRILAARIEAEAKAG